MNEEQKEEFRKLMNGKTGIPETTQEQMLFILSHSPMCRGWFASGKSVDQAIRELLRHGLSRIEGIYLNVKGDVLVGAIPADTEPLVSRETPFIYQ